MAFVTYIRPVVTEPTLQEILASLSGTQKLAILNGYANGVPAGALKHILPISKGAIQALYNEIEEIRDECTELMREEQVIQDAVIDPETGEVTTPAVYNDAPVDVVELKALVSTTFDELFTEAQVGAVIDKMIEYSEIDENGTYIGTWAVYAANVVL